MCGSKGGCGKSLLARNILVAAGQSGLRAVGVDMDRQGTFMKWSERRKKARLALPECVPTEVFSARITEWADVIAQVRPYQIAVVDTAPSVEENIASVLSLCRAATLVIVPTGTFHDDLESVIPWMKTLTEQGMKAAFAINRVNTRTRSFTQARATLLKYGAICPVEIPQLEDIHQPSAKGLVVLDYEKSKGGEPLEAVWSYVRREISL